MTLPGKALLAPRATQVDCLAPRISHYTAPAGEALQTPQVSQAVWQVLQPVVVQVEVPQAGEARKGM